MSRNMSETKDYTYVGDWPQGNTELHPASLKKVWAGGFLGRRVDANITSLLAGLQSPIPRGFEALAQGEQPSSECNRPAADSDLYKWIEGAAYATAYSGDPELLQALERISALVIGRQHPDGYIDTPWLFSDEDYSLYVSGHFIEAAVAQSRVMRTASLLESACRWADLLIKQYETGHPYFKKRPETGHPGLELALIRLYRETRKKQYLDFAVTLTRMYKVGERVQDIYSGYGARHAVRTTYLLTARAELYLEEGNPEFLQYLRSLWEELISTRIYVAGGIGCGEVIPVQPYDLPQSLENRWGDIAETCASVGMMMFSWRMHTITGESRYFDVIERILYNHFLGALSLDNLGIFYYSPLRLIGDQTGKTDQGGSRSHRTTLPKIHSVTCCLPNAWRFLAALPEYLFTIDERGVFVNLYTTSTLEHTIHDTDVRIEVETQYPYEGKIGIKIRCEKPVVFALRLRVPDWCRKGMLRVHEEEPKKVEGGKYIEIERAWNDGDRVSLNLEMPVRMLFSHPLVLDNAGSVAFARGPLIYCLEQDDVDVSIERVRIPVRPDEVQSVVRTEWRPELLGGVYVLRVPATIVPPPPSENLLYYEAEALTEMTVVLVPFYARANRSASARWLTLLPQGPK